MYGDRRLLSYDTASMDAIGSSETNLTAYGCSRCHSPEDHHPYTVKACYVQVEVRANLASRTFFSRKFKINANELACVIACKTECLSATYDNF